MNRHGQSSTAGARLQEALLELNRLQTSDGAAAPTAKALCELAGVSRNALYKYHPAVLHELHKLQRRQHREPNRVKLDLHRLRRDNDELREHLAKLVALVDHYFAAWQEASTQLARRERELAELRRNNPAKVVAIRK
jgi:hypothetical protein